MIVEIDRAIIHECPAVRCPGLLPAQNLHQCQQGAKVYERDQILAGKVGMLMNSGLNSPGSLLPLFHFTSEGEGIGGSAEACFDPLQYPLHCIRQRSDLLTPQSLAIKDINTEERQSRFSADHTVASTSQQPIDYLPSMKYLSFLILAVSLVAGRPSQIQGALYCEHTASSDRSALNTTISYFQRPGWQFSHHQCHRT